MIAINLLKNGHCAACPSTELHIDHCHVTGKVRGLLCGNCNRALGSLFDDKERILRLANYIGKE